MVKFGITKSVLLLAFIGIIMIGLVQPIAGMTDQGKSSGQDSSDDKCNDSYNGQDLSSDECDDSPKGQDSSSDECDDSLNGQDSSKEQCEESDDDNCSTQAEIDRANYRMKKAIKIHEMHLMNPSKATEESNMEMMKEMMKAKKYLEGEKMNMGMMDRAVENKSAEYEQTYAISALMRLDCSGFWLDEAMKLHEMHMKNPETATNESQMRLMAQMVRANRYLAGEDMDMEMAKDTSLSQDNVNFTTMWLEKAIKLHAMSLKAPEAATNESQMRLMNQMMRARECIEGKDLNLEMLMDFEEDSAREMCEPLSSEMCEPSPKEKMMCSMMMNSMRMEEKSYNETMMDSLKSSMMEEKEAKKDKMESMMEEKEAKKDKMESMMEEKVAKKDKMDYMMEEKAAEKDKMDCMMEEKEANESCYTGKMDQKVSLTQANLDCVCLCLEKAIKLHEMYLRNPEAATSESKMEMMKQMMQAHEYLTGEKMDMHMIDKAIDNESAGRLKEKVDCLPSEKSEDCSSSKMGQYSSSEPSKNYSSSGC